MPKYFNEIALSMVFPMLALTGPAGAAGKDKISDPSVKSAQGTLWADPTDIQSRDLFYGAGGKDHQPSGTSFSYVDEDLINHLLAEPAKPQP